MLVYTYEEKRAPVIEIYILKAESREAVGFHGVCRRFDHVLQSRMLDTLDKALYRLTSFIAGEHVKSYLHRRNIAGG